MSGIRSYMIEDEEKLRKSEEERRVLEEQLEKFVCDRRINSNINENLRREKGELLEQLSLMKNKLRTSEGCKINLEEQLKDPESVGNKLELAMTLYQLRISEQKNLSELDDTKEQLVGLEDQLENSKRAVEELKNKRMELEKELKDSKRTKNELLDTKTKLRTSQAKIKELEEQLEKSEQAMNDLLENESSSQQLSEERGRDSGDSMCVICLDKPRGMILIPCGHVCVCSDCVNKLGDKCPICRKNITKKHRAYL